MFQLSDDQAVQYHRDGFVFVSGLFQPEEIELLHKIGKADKQMAEAHSMEDAAGGKSKIWITPQLGGDIYSAFVHDRRIVDPIEQLLGCEVYHWHHKMMLKEPMVGGAWEWHQDYGYWYGDNCLSPDMASCMIAVDRASRENGCLQVLRSSHKLGRLNHGRYGQQAGAEPSRVEAALKRLELVYCEMEPGTALFFHSNMLHRSDQNRSPNARWSLICCYNALHNKPFEGPGHGKPEPLARWPQDAILEIGRRQLEAMQSPTAV